MGGGAQPPLRLLHDEGTIRSNPSFRYWDQLPTADIVASLLPDASEPLAVKPDGTIVQGNTRVYVLLRRGHEVDSLPRIRYAPPPEGPP